MSNSYFAFKQFRVEQSGAAMKVGTDGVLLGAWARLEGEENGEEETGQKAPRVLDIGTGTGVIALMAAQRCPQARIDAIEMDEQAFVQARKNTGNSRWADRIELFRGAVQEFGVNGDRKYDHIVCNPPFFVDSLKAPDVARSTARHNDTLPFDDLAAAVDRLLTPEGRFSVVYPTRETDRFQEVTRAYNLYPNRKLRVRGKPDRAVTRVLTEFSRHETALEQQEMAIETAPLQYTDEYIRLTRDFYLKF